MAIPCRRLILPASLSIALVFGFVPAAPAAQTPAPGVPCASAELGKQVPWKVPNGRGTQLVCVPADGGGDHVPSVTEGKFIDKAVDPTVAGYVWTVWTDPAPTKFTGANLTDLSSAGIPRDIAGSYQVQGIGPCKVNARSIDNLVSMSYGRNGLLGRRSPGMPDSLGKLTVAVVPMVPSNLNVNLAGDSATGVNTDTNTALANPVTWQGITAGVRNNIEQYLKDYFQEQSYGRMTLEFVYYPKIIQGTVNQGLYKKADGTPDFGTQAVAMSQAFRSLPQSWWNNEGKNVDILWGVEWGKPGAYLWQDPRSFAADGTISKFETIATPAGNFRGFILTPVSLPVTDRPLIAHEFAHSMRLPDMYQRKTNTVSSRMAAAIGRLSSGYTISGMLGWSRYINRWLSDEQVECVTGDRLSSTRGEYVDISLTPLQRPSTKAANKRIAVIPLTELGTAIMVESWRPEGSDAALQPNSIAGTGADGALVYLMDARDSAGSGVDVTGSWPYTGAPVILYRENTETVLPSTSGVPPACEGIPDVTVGGVTTPGVDTTACNLALQAEIRSQAFLTKTADQSGGQTAGHIARYNVRVLAPVRANDPCGLSTADKSAWMNRELTIELIARSDKGDRVRIGLGKRTC